MKNIKNLTSVIYFLVGILFFVDAILMKNNVYIPIGCCFVIIGIININKKNDNDKNNK